MDPTAALIAGLAAGLAIAMQVGAVSLLLVETAVAGGPRVGIAAGMGVATVDLLFAAAAVVVGGAAGVVLAEHETEIRLVAAATLAVIAIHGLATMRREGGAGEGAAREAGGAPADADPRSHYVRFFAITLVNPLTIASFAAVATSLPLDDAAAATAFAAGVGAASAGWHLLLTAAAGHAGRWITPRIQRGLGIGGRVAVLLLATHLALGA
ncbi:MAG TPA: LysE family transporter [Thermoleophilaceae bacterium]|nr:LysE family transporter [Thermoleophilaceae bacterium]